MTKLHYVGFNGYQQCPQNQSQLSKVIANWTSITDQELLKICCSHRIVVLETRHYFKVFGVLSENPKVNLKYFKKPASFDSFACSDEFLLASEGRNLHQLHYNDSKWSKLKLNLVNEGEMFMWEEGDKITKLSLREEVGDVVLLLSNGSVWRLQEDKLYLLYPYDLDKAVDIASGLEHTLILTESGCVLSFGNGSRGQLGNGDLNTTEQPNQISALEGLKVIKIACGGWHCCAITDSGDLYTWGWNNHGQLSAFDGKDEIGLTAVPVFVDIEEEPNVRVMDVACGTRHTIARLENGKIYSTGWNAYSQLGLECTSEKITRFTQSNFPSSDNMKLFCGPWYTIIIEKPPE